MVTTAVDNYYDGLNEKLLHAVPDAGKVLELGCANGRLGRRYKELHPDARWYGVDLNAEAVKTAAHVLDGAFALDLDVDSLDAIGSGYDAIVIGDLLEHLKDPERVLTRLLEVSTADARLVCCIPNMAHISVLERMLAGDITYDENGLLDKTHLRFFSPASVFKTFLDAGWMPHLVDHYSAGHANPQFVQGLIATAATIGIPQQTVERNLFMYQLIVECTKAPAATPGDAPPFTVIAAVNRDNQLQMNLLHSPGLAEVGAHVALCRNSASAAEAFEQGLQQAPSPWVIYAHQDVYFPKGSGYALSRLFASVPEDEAPDTLIGFAGMALDEQSRAMKSGLVIDRIHRFDFPASDRAISLDEFAIAVHRSTRHRLDRELGWHLWATDLCLAAAVHGRPLAKIVRIPLFHNSFAEAALPPAYYASAERLSAKYPTVSVIPTLCGNISVQ
jgi:SAM-dependent methyltransferase